MVYLLWNFGPQLLVQNLSNSLFKGAEKCLKNEGFSAQRKHLLRTHKDWVHQQRLDWYVTWVSDDKEE